MNYGIVRNLIGKIMILVGTLMFLPVLICIIYQESLRNFLSFIIPAVSIIGIGFLFNIKKANPRLQAKEGFVIVALSWVIMALVGAIPLRTSLYYDSYIDAFFEMSSGFTTTGATITTPEMMALMNTEAHSVLFFRSFSHWIGGMGVLVLILTIIPESKEGYSVHILRAESPGPQVGRLVSKMKASTRILYLIYIGLSLLETIILWIGPHNEMNLFDSLIYTFGTAGTGGFGINPISIEYYSSYYQYAIAIFMIIFGINFTGFYLILIGKFKEAFKNEELIWYLSFILIAVIIITFNIHKITNTFEEAFRLSLFQTASIISTTGFSTTNFDNWPTLSKTILLLLMMCGACAGSTAGGMKVSRIIIVVKSALNRIRGMINPRRVESIKVNKEVVSSETTGGVLAFFIVYFLILLFCALLVSIDGYDFTTNFSASLACISNVGPGLSAVGPYNNYTIFIGFSKIVLSLEMIAGRLELFPILILFAPRTWKRMGI